MYAEGLGEKQDFVEVGRWAFKSADKGQASAKAIPSVFYKDGASND
jgi:TPR repeat protein